MHATSASSVSYQRAVNCKHDASLEKIVDVARQEFSELTDEEVKTLWIRLQSILIGWAKDRGEALPQYRTHLLGPGKSLNAFSLTDASTSEIDFVFLFFLASRYPPLVKFLQDIAPQPLMSLRKVFGLMILREANARNCPAIKRLMGSFERVLQ